MCGIGGVWYADRREPAREVLSRMSLAMKSRGPDDDGILIEEGIGLVHRRLSIIDLSDAGRCPVSNEDGTVNAVHNGEIYNFAALRSELIEAGHQFRSSGDSEVLVHGYEEWGTGLFARLDGMFAVGIWDSPRRRLLLARDRIGEKPLYLLRKPGVLAFASTLNAIREGVDGDLGVDLSAIECFLSHSFIPHPHTVWKDVESLPPAHFAVIEGQSELRMERYWDFPSEPSRTVTVEEAEQLVEEELDRSVQARLLADVPVGGFLSGGVDSSLVMALAARHSPSIDTFSVGFDEEDFSELPYARRVAEHIGSNHHELVFQSDSILKILPELVWQYGQPFGDSSAVPTHLVSRLARDHVKVCLSGDGGDESFAGYWRSASLYYADLYGRLVPSFLRKNAVPGLASLIGAAGGNRLANRLESMNRLSMAPPGAGYANRDSWLDWRGSLLGTAFGDVDPTHDVIRCRAGRPFSGTEATLLQQALYDDFQVQLTDDYLVKVDVASMAASLEVRPPMLGHHFVESAWNLPDHYKLRRGDRKWLLKRVAAKLVPPEVIYRAKKGFAMPMRIWWRGELATVLGDLMQNSRCVEMGWLQAEPVKRCLEEHVAGTAEHGTRLWLILWLELWVRIVLEGSMDPGTSLAA
ncbi:MAG: asparagine synthase (glutamine-hydrolyzing) [Myxococcota bacterium]|nr:asparagine synthase (glutamine-hydrolyzing) [Myxococcota bacterium]